MTQLLTCVYQHCVFLFMSFVCSAVCVCRGLFKTDRVVGTAQLKLEALENHCDVREIIDVSTN